MSHDQLTPSAPASQASVSGQSHDQKEIPVKCGPIEGSLHLVNLVVVSQEGKVVLNVFIVPLKVNG